MNKAIKEMAIREFGDNPYMVGFDKTPKINALAGTTKAGDFKEHFKKLKEELKNGW